jgi:hypothetical protein
MMPKATQNGGYRVSSVTWRKLRRVTGRIALRTDYERLVGLQAHRPSRVRLNQICTSGRENPG